jgi:hypothetical protein
VLGMRHGVRGLVKDDFVDLTDMHSGPAGRLGVDAVGGIGEHA